ncbi:MAG: homoserine dehydrogenase [Pseudomonadota bacterium]|uniref:homoserine dehydrogenase n=1 Tax=Fodinicurvata fenggangensis TaxID=1121830 RepID=UPI00047CDD8B|nr:homoserine dehydrogenase [Fodinicurvata fenggangensis]
MTTSLKLGIAGLGTVGSGVVRLIEENGSLLAERTGRPLVVSAVSARDRRKDRGLNLEGVRWYDDPLAMAADAELDIIVELIGGSDGVALDLVKTALEHGKSVVTANKAMMAHHGTDLARLAESRQVALSYEAAVAGGIPAIKVLREGLAANQFVRIHGILNGTCNYILSTMRDTGREFGEVLAEAQKLGYAEADPSFDVDGVDAAHKLALLTALAFGTEVDFDSIQMEGIRNISSMDIAYAEELGYRIKLLGMARRKNGQVEQRVHPCMVPLDNPLSRVDGVFNAVLAQGDFSGPIMIEGAGAGENPTASAVVADLMDIARGLRLPPFAVPADKLERAQPLESDAHFGAYFLRLLVVDRPGVIADIATALRDEEISVEALLQRGRAPGEAVPLVIVTHETGEAQVLRALRRIEELDSCLQEPRFIRIENS